jgi:hypothetical protein
LKPLRLLVAAMLLSLIVATVDAHLDGSPSGYTGAPGEGTCADAGCHDSYPLDDYTGSVFTWAFTRTPDTLDVHVEVSRYQFHEQFGFQLSVTDSAGNPAGHFLITDSMRTRLTVDPSGREYVTHTAAGTGASTNQAARWDLRWVWPSPHRQPYTFYASGVASNGDTLPTGDYVYTFMKSYDLPCPIVVPGDVNVDGVLTAADIIVLVNYVFKEGPDPRPCAANGDVNCNGTVTSADIIYLLHPIFKGGPLPCDICNDLSALVCVENPSP